MKKFVRVTSSEDEPTVDVSLINEKIRDLYDTMLQNCPIEPSEKQLWGEGMSYLSSGQAQVLSITLKWDTDIVDGGFEIKVDSSISGGRVTPPVLSTKIVTFLRSRNATEFARASKILSQLFTFADQMRAHLPTI